MKDPLIQEATPYELFGVVPTTARAQDVMHNFPQVRQAIGVQATPFVALSSRDNSWKREREKELALILRAKAVRLVNALGDANEALEFLKEAHKLDPSNRKIKEDIDTVKKIKKHSRRW